LPGRKLQQRLRHLCWTSRTDPTWKDLGKARFDPRSLKAKAAELALGVLICVIELSRYPGLQVSDGGAETDNAGLRFLTIPGDA